MFFEGKLIKKDMSKYKKIKLTKFTHKKGEKMGITNKKIIEAFQNTGGIVSKAAIKLGVSRQAVYSRIQKSEELAKEQQSAKETALDLAEDKLLSNIKAGDNTCIIFFLKTQGKKRGYVEKQEVEQSGSLNLNSRPQIIFNDPPMPKVKPPKI